MNEATTRLPPVEPVGQRPCGGQRSVDLGGEAVELWAHGAYRTAFDALPELAELVSTPFMQQIVVTILHQLQAAGNPAEPALKTELHTLLSYGIWSNILAPPVRTAACLEALCSH